MSSTRNCFRCGALLAPNYADGLCAGCLFRDAVAPPESPPLRRFGEYELLQEIARGGMGVVYKARQRSLSRIVAVKMILKGHLAAELDVRRFQAEGAAAAHLQHPNIVAIHEIGEQEGQHYFSMDFVEGPNLAEVAASGPLAPMRAARYVKTLAEAIHYAHGKGILHRDLKPSNILINPFDQPQITDFGLAKWMHADSDLTISGQILGTPNFMPPEQAASRRGEVGPHSDVYSLGAILYFLLTGAAPFLAPTAAEAIHRLLNENPVPPSAMNSAIPRDLQTICLKCLEKDPVRRYRSARELAEDLDRFVRREPIRARRVGPCEKLWRGASRRPLVTTLAAAVLLLTAVLIVLMLPRSKPKPGGVKDLAEGPPIASIPVLSGMGISGLIDGKVYLSTPLDGRAGQRHFFHAYNIQSNTWTPRADFPSARTLPAGGVIQGKLYVAAGTDLAGEPSDLLEVYDPVSDSWSRRAHLPTPRRSPAGVVFGNRLYVFSGRTEHGLSTAVESFDPQSGQWRSEPPILVGRDGCGVAVIDQTFYIVGGFTNTGARGAPTGITETWKPTGERSIVNTEAAMEVPVGYAFVAVLNGFIYVAGGKSSDSEVAKLQVYWPKKRVWDSFTAMPEARWAGSGVQTINNEFWAFGGWTSFSVKAALPHSDIFVYNPSRNLWRRSIPNEK